MDERLSKSAKRVIDHERMTYVLFDTIFISIDISFTRGATISCPSVPLNDCY